MPIYLSSMLLNINSWNLLTVPSCGCWPALVLLLAGFCHEVSFACFPAGMMAVSIWVVTCVRYTLSA